MGLSIHYSGTIHRINAVPQFVEELTDIAHSMGWDAQAINMDEAATNFRGVIINPTGDCEPLCFIFDRQGRLRALMDLITEKLEPTEYSFSTATKTQFTEIETHVWIIGLLRYLKKHYLHDLVVKDEGNFWETENLEILREKKQFLQGMIDQIADALHDAEPLPKAATLDDIVDRIEQISKKLRKHGHEHE